jgi:alpha-L-arabinofuranosidase
MKSFYFPGRWLLAFVYSVSILGLQAQASLPVYTDHLVNGFQDWSWATRNLANALPLTTVHSGTNSISVTSAGGISFHQTDFNTATYSNLIFWANGGSSGGQVLQVYVSLDSSDQSATTLTALTANTWQQFTVPLTTLHAANKTNLARITIQLSSGSGTYYLDDIQLGSTPAPALQHLGVDASQTMRPADTRWFGANTATWSGNFTGNPQAALGYLKEMGITTLRWPGGSTSDGYHWASDSSGNSAFRSVATNLPGAQVFITVNYGSGTPAEAAAWVLAANKTNNCGFKYWEVGNECYGTWENDTHAVQHDPYTYATNAATFIQQMKSAYPSFTIKVGVVAVPGEDSSSNNATHFAVNPRTHVTHYGWTPIMLNTLTNLGVFPDFVIYHFYPQWTSASWQPNVPDSDPLLLQVASNWATDAADLRQQITDYLGATNGTNIELVCTENNSDSGEMGQQSTSIVNALYLADSAGQLMKTEFNSYVWWDLYNGTTTDGAFDSTLYGWRTYGDYGLLNSSNARHPTFYAEKLLQSFVRAGDTVLKASSDYLLLSAYAARKADGALAMLVINKDGTTNFNAQISITNFVPWSIATARSYGLQQDEAARTNAVASAQDISTNTISSAAVFTNSFPPYSLTLLTFAPGASQLSVSSSSQTQIVLQIQGQSGVPYVIQNSTNLASWNSVSTNTLVGTTLNVTNAISANAPMQFWRAVWLP